MKSALDRLWVFSGRELSEHRGRAFAASAVVAVSTALLVAVLSIIGSIDRSIETVAEGVAGDASLEVSASSGGGFPASVYSDVAAVPGVKQAVPLVQTTVTTRSGPVLLLGTDATAAALQSPLQDQVQRNAARLITVPDGVLVGPGTGYQEGERIRLQGQEVTVAGVLDGPNAHRFNGGEYIFAPLPLAQRVAGKTDKLDSVLVVATADSEMGALDERVTRAVDGRGLVGVPLSERTESSNGVVLIQFVAISAAAMAFLVATFLIYTAMSMAIAGRRPRISMLRAIGGSRRSIVGDLLLETAVLAFVGAAIGSVFGVFVGRAAIGRLPDLFMQSVTAEVEFVLPWWAIPLAITVAVIACVTAAALAARQVYRVSPVEALAPVGVTSVDVVRPRWRMAAGVAGVVLAVAAFFNAMTQPGILANSGISTMFAAEILLGFAFGGPIVRAAARSAGLFGSAGTVAGETIKRAPNRSWATLMTVSVAVAATFAISAGNANAVDSTKDSFEALRGADVWVSSTPAGAFATGPHLPADLADEVSAIPGVSAVEEGQTGYLSLGDQRALVFGVGPDAANPLIAGVGDEVRQKVLAGEGIVVSTDLAESLSLSPGDELTVPTATGTHRTTVLEEVSFFSALNGALVMGLPQMQQWFDNTKPSTLQIRVTPDSDVDAVLSAVREILPSGVLAYTGEEAVQGFGDALNQATSLNHLIWIIVTIIAAVALLNTLLLSVLERRRELGVLRAIGSSRRFTVAMVFAESTGIALVGAVLGLIFGVVQQVVADLASSRAWNVDVAFELVPLSFAMAIGAFFICLLGSLPPAWRVSRVNIINAMRVE